MNKQVDMGAVKQVIEGLRDRIAALEEENRRLRSERDTFASLLQEREQGLGGGTVPLFSDDSDVEELLSASRRAPMRGEPVPGRVPTRTDPGLPLAGSASFARADTNPYTSGMQPGLRAPESSLYGRGLIPGVEFSPERAVPAVSGAAPGFDLGYINQVPAEELERLPYGLIVLDTEGNVLFYNETESKLAGFARERVLGKNFFREVAPCARVQAFEGRFKEFVEGKLGRVTFFDFAFHFARGTQNVLIGLSHGRKKGHINVMMMRR
jgi:photoactive yellow protein